MGNWEWSQSHTSKDWVSPNNYGESERYEHCDYYYRNDVGQVTQQVHGFPTDPRVQWHVQQATEQIRALPTDSRVQWHVQQAFKNLD